jgi:hypothetical protein
VLRRLDVIRSVTKSLEIGGSWDLVIMQNADCVSVVVFLSLLSYGCSLVELPMNPMLLNADRGGVDTYSRKDNWKWICTSVYIDSPTLPQPKAQRTP